MSLLSRTLAKFGYTKGLSFKNPKDLQKIYDMINNSASGRPVTQSTSLQFSGYFAPLLIRARTVMVLPKRILRKTKNGSEPFTKHDQYHLLAKRPNKYQSSRTFWLQFAMNRIHKGNGVAWLEGKNSFKGRPTSYHLLDPDPAYTQLDFQDGDPFIRYNGKLPDGRKLDGWRPYDEFLHVPSDLCDSGISDNNVVWGKGLYHYAKETIGLGLAAEGMTAEYISKNGFLSKYFKHPTMLTVDDRKTIVDHLKSYGPGQKNHKNIPMFDGGMELVESKMNIQDVEPDRLRRFSVEESARFNSFPSLFKLGHQDNSNYANSYQSSIEFRDTTVIPDIAPIQAECDQKLLKPSEYQNGETWTLFDTNGLLQADPDMRSKFMASLNRMGALTANAALKLEGLETLGPEGDIPTTQVQNIPLKLLEKYWEAIIEKALEVQPAEAKEILENALQNQNSNGQS